MNASANYLGRFIKFTIAVVFILVIVFVYSSNSYSQLNYPHESLKRLSQPNSCSIPKLYINDSDLDSKFYNNIGEAIVRQRNLLNNAEINITNSKSSDTLFIGLTPGDSLYITGDYNYNGTIFVLNGGKLVFEESNAVINGDLIVWGDDSKVWILNSTLHFPQMYIYQRSLLSVANAEVFVTNSTFDYYGLSHDMVISQNAKVFWENVTNIGFTTCGLSSGASIEINGTNQAGEYIMTDDVNANFIDATTVLVWHHIPEGATLDYTYPDGSIVENFSFSEFDIGVSGIGYSYSLNNCSDVMWGLMPEPLSNVTIADSKIRTVGVWFKDQPAYEVSGLVNNSHYSDFVAPLSEHNIHFINSDVTTWSLYMFHGAEGTVSNCILGEIGTMGNSECTMQNCLIDGSGGYLFATDTSVLMSAFSYLNCNFQSSGNAFGIMAYGAQNMGKCIAFEKSIMILIQANLVQQPLYYDDAMMWYLYLDGPEEGNTESEISVTGSAWIEKASNYYPTEFAWYVVDYQIVGSEEWLQVCDTVYDEVFSDELCIWNTSGVAPGYYNVRITMCDNAPEQNKVEAIRQLVLTDAVVYDKVLDILEPVIYPNPISNGEIVSFVMNGSDIELLEIYDLDAKKIFDYKPDEFSDSFNARIFVPSSGIYFIRFYKKSIGLIIIKKLVVI